MKYVITKRNSFGAYKSFEFFLKWFNVVHFLSAIDLIQHLLIVEPEKRLSIEQVMQHPWIARHQYAPQTPLLTASVLSEERSHWIEVNVSTNILVNFFNIVFICAILSTNKSPFYQ